MTYTPQEIAKTIDLACLKPTATREDIKATCALANKHNLASVCVPPCYVKLAAALFSNVCTVIGFPHGNGSLRAKFKEAEEAIANGAKELDFVINYGRYLDGDRLTLGEELWMITGVSGDVRYKAILESCHYTMPQLLDASKMCVDYGVDWIKTSTGFASGGATREAVETMMLAVKGSECEVKASGGIRTYQDVETYLDMGCTRLGTSGFLNLLPEVSEHPSQTENY
jgi:deoxyribose-phosphate aldolase